MKAALPTPSRFRFHTDVRVRLPETDALGIVFHGCFFTYFEVGRTDYLRNLDLMEPPLPIKGFHNLVAHASSDFISPARFDDPLRVYVRIAEFGTASFRFEFLVHHAREKRPVAVGRTVHVAVDKRGRPVPVPESFRRTVLRFENGRRQIRESRSRRSLAPG